MDDKPEQYQRTEEPTQKRLEDARRKGDAPRSQEITTAATLIAGAVALAFFSTDMAAAVTRHGAAFIDHPHLFTVDAHALAALFRELSVRRGAALSVVAARMVAFAVLGNVIQARPVFNGERLAPKLSKLSPIAGAKRVFGPTGLVNFAKGVGKILIVGAVLLYALWPDRAMLAQLLYTDERAVLAATRTGALKLLIFTLAALSVIAALDYAWQRHDWRKRNRMTKEEVKRELRETEGDPQIKGRQRQMREQRARRRMLVAVEDATVLIMNPTHFAVALKYELGETEAPICVAKGIDDLALRMRDRAREKGVAVIENPPLARALHAGVELDAPIPLEHYEAVAKIIGFVMAKSRQAETLKPTLRP